MGFKEWTVQCCIGLFIGCKNGTAMYMGPFQGRHLAATKIPLVDYRKPGRLIRIDQRVELIGPVLRQEPQVTQATILLPPW